MCQKYIFAYLLYKYLRPSFEFCWLWTFLQSNSPNILTLCETNLDDSIDSGNFPVRGYFPLIQKDSSIHMHGLAIYVKEGLSFAQNISLENSADSYLCFWLALLHSVSYFFFLYQSLSLSLCMVFDSTSSIIYEVLLINPCANVFFFGDFNIHLILRWLTFLLTIQNVNLFVLLFWIYFFLLMLVFVLQWLSLHWEILIMLLSQFLLTFHQIHNGMPLFFLNC